MDATGFCELLQKDSFDHRTESDDVGRLANAFWPLHSSELATVLWSAKQCVIYDNTFNTSSYDLKLGVFSTVDNSGRSRIVACALLRSEDTDSFVWVMQCFLVCLGFAPNVILTDGDIALCSAIARVFPYSTHLLCIWHLARNVVKDTKGCFGATTRGVANAAWRRFYNAFWSIVLKTDERSIDSFDDEWVAMLALLEETATASEDVIQRAIEYLGGDELDDEGSHSIWDLRTKWAYRFTWSVFTFGANSTQCGEGVFALIKSRVRPGGLLTDLYRRLNTLDDDMQTLSDSLFARGIRMWSREVQRQSALLHNFQHMTLLAHPCSTGDVHTSSPSKSTTSRLYPLYTARCCGTTSSCSSLLAFQTKRGGRVHHHMGW